MSNLLANFTREQLEHEIIEQGRLASALAGDIRRLRKCLSFFASAIKAGEPWTVVCEAEYGNAMQIPRRAGS